MSDGQSGPVARDLIGPEHKRKALEDVAHWDRSQDTDPVTESCPIDGTDLGDVYDAGARESGFTSS